MNKRLFVEKKEGFRVEAESLRRELNENLQMHIRHMRYLCVYDLFGFSDELLEQSKFSVFGEMVTDTVTESVCLDGKQYLAVEYIPGQFDQRASSAIDCVHLIDPNADIDIRSSRLLIFEDLMTEDEMARIRHYYINAVEAREKDLNILERQQTADVKVFHDAIVPQSLPNEVQLKITVKDGTESDVYYAVVNKIKVSGDNTKWEAGKHYVYTLNIKKTGISVTATITDWTTAEGSDDIWL